MTPTPIPRLIIERRTYWKHLAILGILWAVVMTMDSHEEKARVADISDQFAQCLNGTWRGVTESGEQMKC